MHHMETEVVSVDLNKVGHRKTARFDISGSRRVGVEVEDPEPTVLANKELEKSSSDRIQQVSEELKRLTTLSIQQQPAGRLDRAKPGATHALKGLKTISKKAGDAAWNKIEKKFDDLTKDTNGLLPRSLFVECIGMNKESKEFGEELFNSLTRRRNITSDSIKKAQLKELWDQISDRSFDSRLQTFFDMVDKDADGRITEDEVRKIINLSASANNLVRIQEHADEYAALIMTELDPEKRGYILIENLEKLLSQAQEHNVRGETRNLGHLLSQQLNTTPTGNPIRRWYEDFKFFLMDNWQRCWVMVLWIGVMAGLFTWKYIQYKDRAVYKVLGHCVCIAKGSAETLKFNMALILLPVCRNTITWLRTKTGLGVVVPFDDNLNFHKVIAVGISIGVGLHAISHLACDFPRLIHATEEEYRPMQQYFGDQATNYWHFVKATEGYTGIIMTVLMMIAFTLATPWLRRNKFEKYLPSFIKKVTGFNAFWYTHHLFIIVYTLLIVHGIKLYLTKEWYKKTTWMYLAVPITLYACERLMRSFRSRVKSAEIHDATFYPGNVMALHMSKPQGFKYKSGQYMFVKCAAVSPFEWHPFSITSAPDDKDLSVHIKSLGDWTKQLKIVFSEPPSNGKRGLERVEEEISNYPKVVIDGPYGAPSQEYKKYDVVLLVGLGIGATPMISIVKDIVNNMKAKEEEESALENGHTGTGDDTGRTSPDHNFKTKKAYFYWMTKEQGTFDWFRGVMNEAAEMDKHGVIEMHNYCTSVFKEGDVRSTLITLLQSLHHAKNGVDVVTDIRVKTHFARPNWRQVYKDIALKHTGSRIGVFYCGAPAPTQELKQLAHDFSHRTSTKFDFHKENF